MECRRGLFAIRIDTDGDIDGDTDASLVEFRGVFAIHSQLRAHGRGLWAYIDAGAYWVHPPEVAAVQMSTGTH